MSFTPIIPIGGYIGFKFLERTALAQQAAHDSAPRVQRDADYFRENIGSVDTAEDLVSDYRLLRVALGAFGLSDDIGSKFFIQKVLNEGTLNPDSLSNRLTDKRYGEMAKAFGFDLGTPSTKISTFADEILEKFKARSFEAAVGNVDENMRLALNAKRELSELATQPGSENTKWFTIMGNPPLRTIFEGAFNLPASFSGLDLDRQLKIFKEKSENLFGNSNINRFSNESEIDVLVQRFMIMRTLSSPPLASANPILTLLGDSGAQIG